MYTNDITNHPNPRVPYYKQWENIPDGLYLVTRIFRPSKYPSATLVTVSFRVSIPDDDWQGMRTKLFEEMQQGKAVAVRTNHGRWTLEMTEDFKGIVYNRDEFGVACRYEKSEDCYILNTAIVATSPVTEGDDIPF